MGIKDIKTKKFNSVSTKGKIKELRIQANFNGKVGPYEKKQNTLRFFHNGAVRRNAKADIHSYFAVARVCSENAGYLRMVIVYEDGSKTRLSETGIHKLISDIMDVNEIYEREYNAILAGDTSWGVDPNSDTFEEDFAAVFKNFVVQEVLQKCVFKFEIDPDLAAVMADDQFIAEYKSICFNIPLGTELDITRDDRGNVYLCAGAPAYIEFSKDVARDAKVFVAASKLTNALYSVANMMQESASPSSMFSTKEYKEKRVALAPAKGEGTGQNARKKVRRAAEAVQEAVIADLAKAGAEGYNMTLLTQGLNKAVEAIDSADKATLETAKALHAAALATPVASAEETVVESVKKDETPVSNPFGVQTGGTSTAAPAVETEESGIPSEVLAGGKKIKSLDDLFGGIGVDSDIAAEEESEEDLY